MKLRMSSDPKQNSDEIVSKSKMLIIELIQMY